MARDDNLGERIVIDVLYATVAAVIGVTLAYICFKFWG